VTDPIMNAQEALRVAIEEARRTMLYYDYLNNHHSKALYDIHQELIGQYQKLNAIIND
jgi:hypothetical protein